MFIIAFTKIFRYSYKSSNEIEATADGVIRLVFILNQFSLEHSVNPIRLKFGTINRQKV